jgi:DNA-binding CsgD family transcriptional regulator
MPPAEAAGDARADRKQSRAGHIRRGRRAYASRRWSDSYESLSSADRAAPLAAADLELLATAASMVGREDEHLSILERAHRAHLDAHQTLPAARCAFWAGTHLLIRGEMSRASGWLGRAQRLVEREPGECAEQGYLLVPVMMGQEMAGDYEAAHSTAVAAGAIGERFREPDLLALALHQQGRVLTKMGKLDAGLVLLDEVMVAVTGGELSPIVTGLVYCSVIEGCQQVYELRRAGEWTAALTRWCEEQPDMVNFTGRCLVHRAEILQLRGAWPAALDEARRAGERFARAMRESAAGEAAYRQGEIQRLRGEPAAAGQAYREASRYGWEPQPGLALLRLAEGDPDAAAIAIRRVMAETSRPLGRAGLVPAYVEILLAAGDADGARAACRELEEIAEGHRSGMLGAMAAQATGTVALADGDAWAALVSLRRAGELWRELEVPYEAARARVLVGLACRALGDEETARMDMEGARSVFEQLGARPDVARVDSLLRGQPASLHGLSGRELEVLRRVAAGETNRTIAEALVLSERTVDRHVSNILAKLRVPSRAAATAYAYQHRLL